jgi:hypothetical protein
MTKALLVVSPRVFAHHAANGIQEPMRCGVQDVFPMTVASVSVTQTLSLIS